jgi:hypothetical protein
MFIDYHQQKTGNSSADDSDSSRDNVLFKKTTAVSKEKNSFDKYFSYFSKMNTKKILQFYLCF